MSAADELVLYGYWRSSAAYRVRLALAWKRLAYQSIPIDLRTGAQSDEGYRALNPQGLVPLMISEGAAIMQSLAIIEYLEETHPEPALLPADALGRARVRAAAQMVASDIHPVNNLRVLRYLRDSLGQSQAAVDDWARHWIVTGLTALEAFAAAYGGRFLYGDSVSLADLCLVPQMYNARRVETDLSAFPRLCENDAGLAAAPFVLAAHPDAQVDKPS